MSETVGAERTGVYLGHRIYQVDWYYVAVDRKTGRVRFTSTTVDGLKDMLRTRAAGLLR